MRATIDTAGRVVIPKRLRDRLGLRGGEELEISEAGGVIELEPAPREAKLVRSASGRLVFDDGPAFSAEEIRDVLEAGRREREDLW
jgi:AbrB family looped-hinge helix DNA binding protein